MGRDKSIEYPKDVCLVTVRTIASRLWFVNSPELEERILAHLGKYQETYGVEIYGFILMGNHYHLLARFPKGNRHEFVGAFDSIIARLTARYQKDFIDGKLWARRARPQVVPNPEDIENQFLYVLLNPLSSGLLPNLADFRGYRCFEDTINGQSKPFKLVNWSKYTNCKRHNSKLQPKDFEEEYRIIYSRIPGYEKLGKEEYRMVLLEKLIGRKKEIVKSRKASGQGFAGKEVLRQTKPGALPRSTKKSDRHTPRPLILTFCMETKRAFLEMYFKIVAEYEIASKKFRDGDLTVIFPPGTHRPRLFVPAV